VVAEVADDDNAKGWTPYSHPWRSASAPIATTELVVSDIEAAAHPRRRKDSVPVDPKKAITVTFRTSWLQTNKQDRAHDVVSAKIVSQTCGLAAGAGLPKSPASERTGHPNCTGSADSLSGTALPPPPFLC
jgi:hypothetical protein